MLADVTALAAAGEPSARDAKNILDQLNFARAALQKDRIRAAALSLKAFQLQVAGLTLQHRLDLDIAASLAFAAGALGTSLNAESPGVH